MLAAVLVLYAAQSAYSADDGRALENVVFFYVPFAALYVLVARIAWTGRIPGRSRWTHRSALRLGICATRRGLTHRLAHRPGG